MPSLSLPRLTPITRAALWILLSGICSVMMNVLIRVAAHAMHPFEVAFFRCLFGLVLLAPWVVRSGPALLRSRNKGFYLLRRGRVDGDLVLWDHRGAAGNGHCRQLHRAAVRHPRRRSRAARGCQASSLER